MDKTNNVNSPLPENSHLEMGVVELLYKIWVNKKMILYTCVIGAIIGLIFAFSLPKEYKTIVQLAPEINNSPTGRNNLSNFATFAGMSTSTLTANDALYPDLYPDIVKSTPFVMELLPLIVKEEERISVFEYIQNYQKNAWWKYVINSPVIFINWLKGIFQKKDSVKVISFQSENGVYFFDPVEYRVVRELANRIEVQIDKKTYMIVLSVEMQDPIVAAEITAEVLKKLQEYIITYRTQKAKQDLEFTQIIYEEAKSKYYTAQKSYALFEDSNKNIITASYRTEKERLRDELTLAFNVYNNLAQKLEQDKLRVQEKTPILTVIEPAKVPLKPSSPRKMLIVVSFTFIFFISCITYILLKDGIRNFYATLEKN